MTFSRIGAPARRPGGAPAGPARSNGASTRSTTARLAGAHADADVMNLAETDDHPPPASPRRRVVQICHKGAPRRDRPRIKPRNINVSSRALRPDRGLCGRFGQTAYVGRSGRASAGRVAAVAGAPTIAVTTSTTPLGPREHWSGKEPGTRTGPGRPNRSRGPRPSPGPASPSPIFRERVGFQSNAPMGGARSTGNLRARGRTTGRGPANRPQNAPSPPTSPQPLPDEKDSTPPDAPGRPRNNLPGAERRRNVHFALESAVPIVILESKMHLSAKKRAGRGRRGLRRRPCGPRRPRPPGRRFW